MPQPEIKSHQKWSSPIHTQSQSSGTWPSTSPGKPNLHSRLTALLLGESLETPHRRSESTKSRSMTLLWGEPPNSSYTRRRASSASTESLLASQKLAMPGEPQTGWRNIHWTTKEAISEDWPLNEGRGIHEFTIGRGSRARLDSSLAIRSSPSEGDVHSRGS